MDAGSLVVGITTKLAPAGSRKAGDGRVTVKVLSEETGFRKGSSVTVGFKIARRSVAEVHPENAFEASLAGELFYKGAATASPAGGRRIVTIFVAICVELC